MTFLVIGRSGPLGRGLTRDDADALAAVSGGSVAAEVDPWDVGIYHGPWWCPGCSRAYGATLQTNLGEPCCPDCGGPLEEQGAGDDDPEGAS